MITTFIFLQKGKFPKDGVRRVILQVDHCHKLKMCEQDILVIITLLYCDKNIVSSPETKAQR